MLFVTLTPAGITDNLSTLEAEILDFFGVSNRSAVPTEAQFDDATLVQKVNYLEDKLNQVFQSASNGKASVAGELTRLGVTTANNAAFSTIKSNITELSKNRYNAGVSAGYNSGVSAGYSNGFTAGKSSAESEAQNLSKIIFGQTYTKVSEVLYEAGKTYPVTTNIDCIHGSGYGNRVIRAIGIRSACTTNYQHYGVFRMLDMNAMQCIFSCNYDGPYYHYTYAPTLSGRIVDRTSGKVICSGNFYLEPGRGASSFDWPAGWLCMKMYEKNDFDYDGVWTYTTGSADVEAMLNNNNIVFECNTNIHVVCYQLSTYYS